MQTAATIMTTYGTMGMGLAERLPGLPFVVGPGTILLEDLVDFEIGVYGGTLRYATTPGFDPHVFIGLNEQILWPKGTFHFEKGIQGNVVEDFEVSDDNKVFTFHMRRGLRWSDGHPVTTEDVRFAYEDIMLNEQLTPVFPRKYRAGARSDGEIMSLEIVDDFTFRLSFSEPFGSFPAQISMEGWVGYQDLIVPSHYLRQFHINYTSLEELQPLLHERELADEWWNLFNFRNVRNWDLTNPEAVGFPSLLPWVMVSADGGVRVYERNPYYYKVDPAGNQLPYIDRLRSEEVADFDMITMRGLTGGLDYLGERSSMRDLPLLTEHAERGNFNIVIAKMHRTPYTAFLNLTYPDPIWRTVVGDVRFRRALNLAIDRQEIIDMFFLGFASPPLTIPGDYDPDEAERLLDEMGLDQRDEEGYRLGPDGKRFAVHFEVVSQDAAMVPITELIVDYWQGIGVYTTMRQIEGALRGVRQNANELQATAGWISENMWRRGGTWNDYLPQNTWAPLWVTWYNTQGREGEEPPEAVKEIYDLHTAFVQALVGSEESSDLMQQIYDLYYENLFFLNVVEYSYYPTILSKDLRNVPGEGPFADLGINLMHSPEQWFLVR